MKRCSICVAILSLVFAGLGCHKAPPQPEPTSIESLLPRQAQPQLPTLKLLIGAEEMQAEMALSAQQVMTGMMFRTNMAENAGMLFILGVPQRASFWMKNCPLPLDAAYIDPEGKILEIRDLEPFNTNSVVANSDNVLYVIEANRGWFARKKIGPGTIVCTERGSLSQTFFGRR